MEIAKVIAGNHRGAVQGVKALLFAQQGENLEARSGLFNANYMKR